MRLLELSAVTRRYRGQPRPAVEAVSLSVSPGEILGLLGPSGSGKTTLLRLIAGFELPDEGTVTIAGRVVAAGGGDRHVVVPPERRGVGIVFQDGALFPHLTVADNVAFGLSGADRGSRRVLVEDVLDLAGITALARRFPHELSGGQQQLVALARALAPAPAILLLDEPFSNLDADLREQMRLDVARILRGAGTTAVFVTHGQDEALAIADRVGVLHHGRLEQLDTPERVYHEPASPFVAQFVGAATFLPGTVTADGIVTEVGTFLYGGPRGSGESVDVMIRPDDVTFEEVAEGDARVLHREFRGTETRYRVELASGLQLYSSQPSWAGTAVGARIRVMVRLEHVVVFPSTAAPA